MWLLFDVFLDRVSDIVVDLATVAEILLDFSGIAHVFLFAILVSLALFFILNFVSVGIELFFFKLSVSFILVFYCLCFLQRHFGAKLFQELVRLFEDLHES